jgi:hypothetical protein
VNIADVDIVHIRPGRIPMTDFDPKSDLHHYLCCARSAVVWKLNGLSEYDLRQPMTGTGTNLLGLVEHVSGVELLYFGVAFGRFPAEVPGWFGESTGSWCTCWPRPNAMLAMPTSLVNSSMAQSGGCATTLR